MSGKARDPFSVGRYRFGSRSAASSMWITFCSQVASGSPSMAGALLPVAAAESAARDAVTAASAVSVPPAADGGPPRSAGGGGSPSAVALPLPCGASRSAVSARSVSCRAVLPSWVVW